MFGSKKNKYSKESRVSVGKVFRRNRSENTGPGMPREQDCSTNCLSALVSGHGQVMFTHGATTNLGRNGSVGHCSGASLLVPEICDLRTFPSAPGKLEQLTEARSSPSSSNAFAKMPTGNQLWKGRHRMPVSLGCLGCRHHLAQS